MYIVNSLQMYAAESNCVKRGTSFYDLMEKAGYACAQIIYDSYCNGDGKSVLVISGKGKNGGDGFVIARALWEMGCKVKVLLAYGEPKSGDQLENYNLLEPCGIDVFSYNGDIKEITPLLKDNDITVDAIFGTGFHGKLDDSTALLAGAVNAFSKKLVSIDIPSGADGDNATVEGEVFLADMTIAISAYKPIHIMKPACKVCGEIKVADIGITDSDFANIESEICYTVTDKEVNNMLPKRHAVSNKGTFGHALCVCGSKNMPGAAYMSVMGALRSGAGLVTAAFPKSAYPALTPKLTECLLAPTEESFEGTFAVTSLSQLTSCAKRATAALVGCGIGFSQDTARLTEGFLKSLNIPVVIDADALNILSRNTEVIRDIIAPVILTPHPGEMSRLTGIAVKDIVKDPVRICKDFAKEYNCVVVLKGANTVVCDCGKTPVFINTSGNSGLAKGGSGDLLAGIMVSLLAQGMEPMEAAVCAVFMHGDAADEVAKKTSTRGMLATDIINYLPEYYGKYES